MRSIQFDWFLFFFFFAVLLRCFGSIIEEEINISAKEILLGDKLIRITSSIINSLGSKHRLCSLEILFQFHEIVSSLMPPCNCQIFLGFVLLSNVFCRYPRSGCTTPIIE